MTIRNLRLWLAGTSLAAATALSGGAAQAAEFELGEANLAIDTVGSVGFGVRVHDQDCTFISEQNGGCASGNGVFFAVNDDDGNVNFERGDFTNATAKVTTDFDLRWRNYGAFVRATAFYDYIGAEEAGSNSTRFGRRPLNDSLRGDSPEDRAGRGARLLDAFVYGNFDVGNLPLNVRVGNQVINWGESLFIQGGINSNLSFDVTALRTPGSELKEAVLPQPAIYASLGLPANLDLSAYYVWDYKRTKLDTVGTYFSSSDSAGDEGAYVMNGVEFGEQIIHPIFGIPLDPAGARAAGLIVPRTAGGEPDDQGQWGAKLGYYAEWLNQGTDLGFYFQNFHNKLPIGTFTSSQVPGSPNWGQICAASINTIAAAAGAPVNSATPTSAQFCIGQNGTGDPGLDPLATGVVAQNILTAAAYKEYRNTYIEDIEMWGASFNTLINVLGGTALAGEIAYSPNMPFQINDVEINANDLDRALVAQAFGYAANPANALESADDLGAALAGQNAAPVITQWSSLATAGEIPGYKRADVVTGQIHTLSTLSASEPVVGAMGADLLLLLANVGFQYLPDQSDDNERFSVARSGAGHPNQIADALLGQGQGAVQYATSTSWGYRLVGALDYNNAFGTPWTLTPSIQFAHDVSGFSAGPVGPGFVEGKKTVSVGLTANLQSTWRAEMRYTNSFGNKFYNYAYDKDFATFNISYAF
ncbi:DUF1302 domain-containing protein [Tepidicaulis sp. LMO-SS28]|uniref:DUF1302 domain-containing protein n=1 Tax=Tepidicaulis sp. LMO-SS28 TaxID=3447455 RepID=UPI003EE4194D